RDRPLLAQFHQRPLDDLLQALKVDVRDLVDVQALLEAALVFAQLLQQLLLAREIGDIEGEVRLARTESRRADGAGVAAFIGVVIGAEADDRRSPHAWLPAGGVPERLQQCARIGAAGLAVDGCDVVIDADRGDGGLRLVLAHGSLPDPINPSPQHAIAAVPPRWFRPPWDRGR